MPIFLGHMYNHEELLKENFYCFCLLKTSPLDPMGWYFLKFSLFTLPASRDRHCISIIIRFQELSKEYLPSQLKFQGGFMILI